MAIATKWITKGVSIMSTRKTSMASKIAAGVVGALFSAAPVSVALAGPGGFGQPGVANVQSPIQSVSHYCCRHHHHHHHHGGHHGYFTSLTHAGAVSYPIYRIDHYKVDYVHPTYTYSGGCCGW